ncbi:c-type cytochrome [Amphiplicatus metriothermophilus]|uniref:Cytochrome c n=1 Tax=Amphiplicatus metriothermophilus TaxID=1519374 RepID=A0A239PV80_9PROT|nr:c-type cytochrome [Amphiplicatus metriothermophilus]MBB5519638.1 mono/diheme cytochrome c family protein [Amphiplicatus metriothermophilus]SNT74201.1 Cytochrome c [Amphiplicatus metriothermophilus]
MRIIAGLMLTGAALAAAGCAQERAQTADATAQKENKTHGLSAVEYDLDAEKGRALFVTKGCVICHAVNGVGGKAAPVLDAQIGEQAVDPLDFAARIWWGAPAMIELQSVELGYTINLTGEEIAHLAAFAADAVEQKKLSADQIPEPMRDLLLDERFWEVEDWDEFLREGREGYEPEPPEDAPQERGGE